MAPFRASAPTTGGPSVEGERRHGPCRRRLRRRLLRRFRSWPPSSLLKARQPGPLILGSFETANKSGELISRAGPLETPLPGGRDGDRGRLPEEIVLGLTIVCVHIICALMTNSSSAFSIEHTIDTSIPAGRLWSALRDVAGWKQWNSGVEDSALEGGGAFAAGTWFCMKPPGQDALRSRLTAVREGESFVDETCVGDLVVTVAHRLDRAPSGQTRITYALEAAGPDAAAIGPLIAADFPEVLAALVAFAAKEAS